MTIARLDTPALFCHESALCWEDYSISRSFAIYDECHFCCLSVSGLPRAHYKHLFSIIGLNLPKPNGRCPVDQESWSGLCFVVRGAVNLSLLRWAVLYSFCHPFALDLFWSTRWDPCAAWSPCSSIIDIFRFILISDIYI